MESHRMLDGDWATDLMKFPALELVSVGSRTLLLGQAGRVDGWKGVRGRLLEPWCR